MSGGRLRRVVATVGALGVLAALLGATGDAGALPQTSPAATWSTDGIVRDLVRVGDVLYVGGQFTEIHDAAGTSTLPRQNLAAFDARTGAPLSWAPAANAAVFALERSADGTRIYAGGDFTAVDGVARSRLASLDAASGAVDTAFRADTSGRVWAILRLGNALYVGGDITAVAGAARDLVAKVNPDTGVLWYRWRPAVHGGSVRALAPSPDGTRLYLGGSFRDVAGGDSTANLAAVSTADASLSSWRARVDEIVLDVLATGDAVYVAMGGSGANPSDLLLDGEPGGRGLERATVSANAAVTPGAALFGAGGLSLSATASPSYVRWGPGTLAQGHAYASMRAYVRLQSRGAGQSVDLFTLGNSHDLANFDFFVTGDTERFKWDLFRNDADQSSFVVTPGRWYFVEVQVEFEGNQHTAEVRIDGVPQGTITSSGSPLAVRELSVGADVAKTHVQDYDEVAVRVGDAPLGWLADGNRLARYAASTGAERWRRRGDGDVQALARQGTALYVGGHFQNLGGRTAHQVAALDTRSDGWLPFDPDFRGVPGVWELTPATDGLWAGGQFASVGGQPRGGLALLAEASATAELVGGLSRWRYWDRGGRPAATWNQGGYDHGAWPLGPRELGAGDGDEATVINRLAPKHVTDYFRVWFNTPDPSRFGTLTLSLLADDGAVVYLNGTEVVRDNLPAGTVNDWTVTSSGRTGSAERAWRTWTLPATGLQAGANLLAVELHQSYAGSDDSSFDLRLLGS